MSGPLVADESVDLPIVEALHSGHRGTLCCGNGSGHRRRSGLDEAKRRDAILLTQHKDFGE